MTGMLLSWREWGRVGGKERSLDTAASVYLVGNTRVSNRVQWRRPATPQTPAPQAGDHAQGARQGMHRGRNCAHGKLGATRDISGDL